MIKTNRLVLKPMEDKDQKSMIEIFTNNQIKQTYMLPDFKAEEEAVRLFKRMQEIAQKEDTIDSGIYLEDRLIGFWNTVFVEEDKIELGCAIHPEYHKQGYGTETLQAMIKRAFQLGYRKVVAGAFEENIASRRIMEKSGMHLTEETEDIEYRGKVHHCVYYSIEKKNAI